jgi:hypothetical protein
MTVCTKDAQVVKFIVCIVTIYMIHLKWYGLAQPL